MKFAILAAAAAHFSVFACNFLHAEPVPLTQQELWDGSDAVVIAQVVRLTRSEHYSHQGTPVFIAGLRVTLTLKGNLSIGSKLVWHVAATEVASGDSGSSLVYPGDIGRIYLRKRADGTYATWNDASTQWMIRQSLFDKELPNKIGETVRLGEGKPIVQPNLATCRNHHCRCCCCWRSRHD